MIYKKSISAIIILVLLVAVSVSVISLIMSFSKDFTNKSIEKVDTFEITVDNSLIGSIFVVRATNNKIFLENKKKDVNITIKAYRILTKDLNPSLYKLRNLDTPKELSYGDTESIDVICFPDSSFELELITIENTSLNLQVNVDNYKGSTCFIEQAHCPTGYIAVPGNEEYTTKHGFCVMKYEAKVDKNSDGIGQGPCQDNSSFDSPGLNFENFWAVKHYYDQCQIETSDDIVSSAKGAPIINVSQEEAKELCNSIGENYALINNDQWMTIARNIENVNSNWTGGNVGEGVIKLGNVYTFFGPHSRPTFEDPNGVSATYFAEDIDSGENRNDLAKLTLSNGQEIWDFSGNVSEWVDETLLEAYCDGSVSSKDNGSDPCGVSGESPSLGNITIPNNFDFVNLEDYGAFEYKDLGPENRDFTARQGIGQIYIVPGYANNTYITFTDDFGGIDHYNSPTHAFLRGGSWHDDYSAGPFALNLGYSPNAQQLTISSGFRCVYDPYNIN